MKFEKFEKFYFAIVAAFIALCMGLTIYAAFADGDEIRFEDKYFVGETVDLPNKSFDFSGNGVAAEKRVELPDGSVIRTDRLLLSQAGKYTVEYCAKFGGETKSESYSFNAYGRKFETSGNVNASAWYVKDVSFTENGESTVKSGIKTTLLSGSSLKVNKLLDLSDLTKNDTLIKLYVMSSVEGAYDFRRLDLRFTDVFDPENYVDVVLDLELNAGGVGTHISYIRAGAAGEDPCGLEGLDYHNDGRYGTPAYVAFSSKNSLGRALDLRMDYATKCVYIENNLVADLTSRRYFDGVWDGFDGGSCTLSISCERFESASCDLFVETLAGGLDDFSDPYLTDSYDAEINIDLGGYEENNLPYAVAGRAYKTFPASAAVRGGNVKKLAVRVFRQYNSAEKISVSVDRNGCFVPPETGAYTIEYLSVDYFGKETRKTLNVDAVADSSYALAAQITGGGDPTGVAGKDVRVNDWSVSEASGDVTCSVTAYSGASVIAVDPNTKTFRPETEGEYTVRYVFRDYVGRELAKEYKLTVKAQKNPIFDESVTLPRYFVQGYKYSLPVPTAYLYNGGKRETEINIYVSENGEAEKKLDGNEYTPTVSGGGYPVSVRYEAKGADAGDEESLTVTSAAYPVFASANDRAILKDKLFVRDSSVTASYELLNSSAVFKNVIYTFDGDGKLSYINRLPAHDFSVRFGFSAGGGTFDNAKVVLTDTQNANEKIVLTLNNAGGSGVTVNDSVRYALQSDILDITYDKYSGVLTVGGISVNVNTVTNGGFAGFSSGAVYADIELYGAHNTRLCVYSICNQRLDETSSDVGNILYYFKKPYNARYKRGETLTVERIYAFKTIDPTVNLFLTVTDPSGNTVTAKDGTLLSGVISDRAYDIELSAYGKYKISYTGTANLDNFISVPDDEPPVLSTAAELLDTYSVGSKVKLAGVATDNTDRSSAVFAGVIDPDGALKLVENNSDYTFEKAGKYEIVFFAYDSEGNYGELTRRITVK